MKKLTALAALGGLLIVTGCGDPAPTQPPQPYQCIEADGEPCDDDPLDLDDLFERGRTPSPYRLRTPAPRLTTKVRR